MSADFVVVGAGSAGCVLANRLTENGRHEVTLLEAGGSDWSPLIHMPGGMLPMALKQLYGWKYWTEPQVHLDGRRLFERRGRVLGGSSAINGMIYCRGAPQNYDAWEAAGNRGWSYAHLLPYFKRAEANPDGADAFHGRCGPLRVTRLRVSHPLAQAFLDAGLQAGHAYNDDINGATRDGFGPTSVTAAGGRRISTAVAYLKPARRRRNLRVITGAQATRILFEGRRAVGVEYVADGRRHTVRAGQEVIVAAGAYNSPHLLLLSGLGEAAALRQFGIPVTADLPGVGRNLQDHLGISVATSCRTANSLAVHYGPLAAAKAVIDYALLRRGPLYQPPMEATGLVRSRDGLAIPDLKFHFVPALYADGGRTLMMGHGYVLATELLCPRSRGEVRLRSADPLQPPVIDPRLLADPADLESARAGLKMARHILAQPAFDPHRGDELFPGPGVRTDDEIDAWVRGRVEADKHTAGTCRMGIDRDAVVDPQLRVRGVAGLRVVDASIMPDVVSGNTNAPTIAIAEKASDMILGLPALPREEPPAVDAGFITTFQSWGMQPCPP